MFNILNSKYKLGKTTHGNALLIDKNDHRYQKTTKIDHLIETNDVQWRCEFCRSTTQTQMQV